VKIGSLFWRIKNYGIIAAFRYLYTEKINKSFFDESSVNLILSLSELNNKLFKNEKKDLLNLEEYSDKIFKEISDDLMFLDSNGLKIKRGVIGASGSKTRLKVLAYIIYNLNFDLIIESGTQHGVSALFIEKFLISKKLKIYSLDIKSNVIPEGMGNIKYEILFPPVRKSFKEFTRSLIFKNGTSLYFHDSDHSYENMTFEFNWVWNEMKVDCLISDDVSENSAFSKFASRNKLVPYFCKFDSGSVVGLVLRQT
jgi:hypothetical protein